jgi:hypothetical protein
VKGIPALTVRRSLLTVLAMFIFVLSFAAADGLQTRRRPYGCRQQACDVYFDDTHDRRTWERFGIVIAGGLVAFGLRSLAIRREKASG